MIPFPKEPEYEDESLGVNPNLYVTMTDYVSNRIWGNNVYPWIEGASSPFTDSTTSTVDSYSESNVNNHNTLYLTGGGNHQGLAQSFTGTASYLYKATFYLSKNGSPTGNMTAVLYAHSGTFGTSSIPTGVALATSTAIDASTLTTSDALVEFTFSGTYLMTAGTKYTIAILYSGGDTSNYVQVGVKTSGTHAGNSSLLAGSSWTQQATIDAAFYVTGNITTTLDTKLYNDPNYSSPWLIP